MNQADFYSKIEIIFSLPPDERWVQLVRLHVEILKSYKQAVHSIDLQLAAKACSDGRSVAQLVAHIAEWDRFFIQSAGEMVSGVGEPGIMNLTGYVTLQGERRDFSSLDEFNALQTEQYTAKPWAEIQKLALRAADAAFHLYANRELLPPDLLEATPLFKWQIPGGKAISIGTGWYIWMVVLEHEAVDHALDLGI
jgi:hypothetical protein